MNGSVCARFAAICRCLWLGPAGCGGSKTPPEPPPDAQSGEQVESVPAEGSHELKGMTVSVADPEGRWTFEVEADRGTAASIHGPYELERARGRYEESGRPPILMSAQRAYVDEQAQRVRFEDDVVIESSTWTLTAERVEYDLETGEGAATSRTK